jgi:hypothetical protein
LWKNTLVLTSKGKTETINFDKKMPTYENSTSPVKGRKNLQTRLEKNILLNNFVNCRKQGYLQEYSSNFLGKIKWKNRLCVMSNVGLLIFDDPLAAPIDLFPLIDCDLQPLAPIQNIPFIFQLSLTRKQIKLRCSSKEEREEWCEEIKKL